MSARKSLVAVLAVCLLGIPALALELGDAAPPLKVDKWIKGGPVDLKDGQGKNTYVLEFWATWCGPCIASIPHMNELQKQYKDKGVVIVSISSSDENLEVVQKFVDKKGDKMGYVVGYENRDNAQTSRAYMDGFKKQGIPQCFVIDKEGKIVWEGHPRIGLAEVLALVTTGKYDVKSLKEAGKKAEQEFEKTIKMYDEYLSAAKKTKDVKAIAEQGRALLKAFGNDAGMLNDLSWTILTDEEIQARDLELALAAAEAANRATEGEDPGILDTYAKALFDTGKTREAIEAQEKAVRLAGDNKRMKAELEERLQEYKQKAGKGEKKGGEPEKP